MPGCDLDVSEVDSGIKHGGHISVAKHVGVDPSSAESGRCGEMTQSSPGAVEVHAAAASIEQDRADTSSSGGAVDGARDRGWERNQHVFVPLAAHQQDAVAVFLAQILDVRSGRLEDPQAKEAEQGNQGEVEVTAGVACGGEDGFELQMGEP
jgi:hypothetical protein